MKLTPICVTVALLSLTSVGGAACADSLVITYSSGKVQTVQLQEGAKEVQEMRFGDASIPLPEKAKKSLSEKQAGTEKADRAEEQGRPKKEGATIKWAPPLSE